MDFRICQTSTASPAEPGGLPLTLAQGHLATVRANSRRFAYADRESRFHCG